MTAQAKLQVDPIACDGRGLCAEVAPELVTLDDWGFPVIGGEIVPPEWMVHAREAVRLCPKLALSLAKRLVTLNEHPSGARVSLLIAAASFSRTQP